MIGLRDHTLIYLGIILGAVLGSALTVVYGWLIALVLVVGAAFIGLLRIRSKVRRGKQ